MLHQHHLLAGGRPEGIIVIVTPLIARTLLGEAGMALQVNPAVVAAYAADMASGMWKLNGVPIVIGRDARVLEGVKRLRAAAEYGVPFPTLLITGIDPAVGHTLNAHKPRSTVNALSIHGLRRAKTVGIAAQALHALKAGQMSAFGTAAGIRLPAQAQIDVVEAFPELGDSVVSALRFQKYVEPGRLAALHFLFTRVDRAAADSFLDATLEGDLEQDDPRMALRRAYHHDYEANRRHGRRRDHNRLAALTIKAWNAHLAGERLSLLKMGEDEAFPEIAGVEIPELPTAARDAVMDEAALRDVCEAETGRKGVTVELVMVTPDLAAEWLRRNDRNRPIDHYSADKYARDMANGDWPLNGATVKFDRNGKLIDGQHRLTACVQSGRKFQCFVVRGLDPEAFATIDSGAKRQFGHVLRSMGVPHWTSVAAALRLLWLHERGMLKSRVHVPSVSELLDCHDRNPGIAEFDASLAEKARYKMPSGAWIMVNHALRAIDPDAAKTFMQRLSTGLGFTEDTDPVYVLTRRLENARAADGKGRRTALRDTEILALAFLAWNAFRKGQPRKQLAWKQGDAFPVPA